MPRASFKVMADSSNLAHWTIRKRFKRNKKKNQTFLKKKLKMNFQPSPWQEEPSSITEAECSEPKQNAWIRKNGHPWLNYSELNTDQTLYHVLVRHNHFLIVSISSLTAYSPRKFYLATRFHLGRLDVEKWLSHGRPR